MIGGVAIAIVLIFAAALIGIAFGRSIERAKRSDEVANVRLACAELEGKLDGVNVASRLAIAARDREILELRVALEAEKRGRIRDHEKPANWGEVDHAPAQTLGERLHAEP